MSLLPQNTEQACREMYNICKSEVSRVKNDKNKSKTNTNKWKHKCNVQLPIEHSILCTMLEDTQGLKHNILWIMQMIEE